MSIRVALALCAAIIILFPAGPTAARADDLTVQGGEPVEYQCENGEKIVARYYSLSDNSLHFVKVIMPDGKEYTLPNVLSASGARYTDEVKKVWWTKGNTAFVQERDPNGEWRIEYNSCCEIGGKK